MRLISWNVNGLRAAVKKGFIEKFDTELGSPDVVCLQETKAQDDQILEALEELSGYHITSNSAVKKGYSGVTILSKRKPLSLTKGLGIEQHDTEGRVITAEFDTFFLVTVYTPNSQNALKRLPYRMEWDAAFKEHLSKLDQLKPVVCCGDLNVAHKEIDIARPKGNYNKSPGYTQDEIDGLTSIIQTGFIDTFRTFHPDTVKYSWWSFRANARENNVGWRLDYFLASERLTKNISEAEILTEVEGSDHCPVVLELN